METAESTATAKAATPSKKLVTEKQEAKPPLKLASKSRKLEFSMPAKPERPPTQLEVERAVEEDDDDKDLQAAIHLSHPPSGAQSSEPKGATDLDQQESELLTQLDHLMAES